MVLQEITVGMIADLVRDAKDGGPKLCLLIGAGASKTAGIGLAADFVKRIQKSYPHIYDKACSDCQSGTSPSYAECMAVLTPAKQVQLVRNDIDGAKINWAHIGIARLEREGVVDAILTPNFDPLASRACALFNRFPAIYDLAGLRDGDGTQPRIDFEKSYVKGSAIFHLHGQHSGFLLLNTLEKLQSQAKRIRPVLDAVMKGKPVIITGYSGENDPLVDEIADLAPFNHGLFWVCHGGDDPAPNVCEKLLVRNDCYLVRNSPADRFFTDLANSLDLQAPGFLAAPFSHMREVLETLRPFSDVDQTARGDLLEQAKDHLKTAEKTLAKKRPQQATIARLMSGGKYQEVVERYVGNLDSLSVAEKEQISVAATTLGNRINEEMTFAKIKEENSENRLRDAIDIYKVAIESNPYNDSSFNGLGNTYAKIALLKSGTERKKYFEIARSSYETALNYADESGRVMVFGNIGLMLMKKMTVGEDRKIDRSLLSEAKNNFLKCEELKTGSESYNLACVAGLLGNLSEVGEWLRLAKDFDPEFKCQDISSDPDFDGIRDHPEFQKLLVEIGCAD